MGRFLTPDWAAKPITVPYASFGDPQTLNLYTYVENGPLNRVDADGHAPARHPSQRIARHRRALPCRARRARSDGRAEAALHPPARCQAAGRGQDRAPMFGRLWWRAHVDGARPEEV